ncbi:mechanosensitive ion channel domain-containing protein [Desulfosarcina sp.]|uniref:mechanosensitive ion channel domain-containing protein n=1 Tax=Desulfosarcina sp. TaxID=2027861 RepID=UPI003568B425
MKTAMKLFVMATSGRWGLILTILLLLNASPSFARDDASVQHQTPPQYTDLKQTVQATLQAEKRNLSSVEKSIQDHEARSRDLNDELELQEIQLSTTGNLLLTPGTRIDDLEKAWLGIRSTVERLNGRQAELKERLDAVQELAQQLTEQKAIADQQLEVMKTDKGHTPEAQALIGDLNALIRSQAQRVEILGELQTDYADLITRVGDVRQGYVGLAEKFSLGIKEKKRADLFQRTVNPIIGLGWKNIGGELKQLGEQIRKFSSLEYWLALGTDLLASRGLLPVTSVLLYLLTLVLIMRLRRFCRQLKDKPFGAEYPWRRMAIRLLTRSMPQLGTALFFYIFFQARGLFTTVPGIQETFFLLVVWLFTKWGLNFITLQAQQEHQLLPTAWTSRLKRLLRLIRYFAAIYLVLAWMLGPGGVLLMAARITFEAALVAWIFRFRPTFRAHPMSVVPPEIWQKLLRPTLSVLGHTIFITGPVLELAGYGALSLYWFTSWGATIAALFWGLLFFLILREGGQRFYKGPHSPSAAPYRSAEPIRWAVFQLCWLLWGILLVITVVLAWSGTQTVFTGLAKVLRFPVSVGDSSFTLMGLISAALILFITHLLIRLWRHVLSTRILARSGLESGLQHSMTSITVYLLWGAGVLVALHAFGLSSTSLTVAFGALGIGLGFGLQNIFNNFISGIILLFERPIQVGDAVEINGIWAEVKKIRFRSTVVQTFDNASLIIPNSEFISSQVTNWSFRDLTLRIKVSVGVAYGSDIELVRSSLLEIAGRTDKVLANPRPDVLFSDFGDSALIFVLRVWTDVDNMLKVATAIRFEIDRVFRERNLEIAFPQRDIHIRSSVTAQAANEFTVEVEPPTITEVGK